MQYIKVNMYASKLCREGAAARQELEGALQAAERQREAVTKQLAGSWQQVQQARLEQQQAQDRADELQQQAQDWQDHAHQTASQMQVQYTLHLCCRDNQPSI